MTALADEIAALRKQVDALTLEVRRLRPRETAHVPPGVTVGENVRLDPNITLWGSEQNPITIGDRTNIYRNAEINGPVSIGEGCLINRDGYIRGGATIGDRVFIGPFVRIVTDSHGSLTRFPGHLS